MAGQTTTSSVLAALGDAGRRAHAKHKNDETKISNNGELPAGIENGIAQLTEMKFDKTAAGKENAGKLFFYAAGIVKKPKQILDASIGDMVPVEGMRTSIMEVLYDTPTRTRKTFDEHWAWVLNVLRVFGVDTSKIPEDQSYYQRIEAIVQALKTSKPPIFFRFRTWKGAKATTGQYKDQEPRVNHTWGERVEFDDTTDPGAGVEEAPIEEVTTPAEEQSNEPLGADLDAAPTETSPDVEYSDTEDLDSLLERAKAQDVAAETQLVELAVAAGHEKDKVESNDIGWDDVVEMIKNPVTAEEPEPPAEPVKGATTKYLVRDKAGKPVISAKTKKEAPPVNCEIVAVDKKKSTVDLKNLVDGKTVYKAVPWSQLIA